MRLKDRETGGVHLSCKGSIDRKFFAPQPVLDEDTEMGYVSLMPYEVAIPMGFIEKGDVEMEEDQEDWMEIDEECYWMEVDEQCYWVQVEMDERW